MSQNTRPYTFDRVVRMTFSALAIGGGLYLLYLLKGVLLPFFMAWLVAYLLSPVVRFMRRKLRLPNGVAVIFTLVGCVGVIVLLGMLLIPMMQDEILHINELITNYELTTFSSEGIPVNIHDIIVQYVDFKSIQESMSKETVTEIIQYISPAIQQIFSNTLSFLLGITVVFIILLYIIFILLDYDKINDFWRFLIPPKYRPIVSRITLDVENGMNRYFRYQALICVILAVLYSIGFVSIGLPMAIIFGIFVGAIHMIPYFQVISFPPAVLLCWLGATQSGEGFWSMIGFTILVYIAVQCILDLFLIPRIMGKAMGLNPAIILLSLSIWGYFLGVVGMIIAIPLTTLLLSYYREFLHTAEHLQQAENKIEKIENPDKLETES